MREFIEDWKCCSFKRMSQNENSLNFATFQTSYYRLDCKLNHLCMISLTGNSANQAIELLIQKGVPESYIIFLNLISVSSLIHGSVTFCVLNLLLLVIFLSFAFRPQKESIVFQNAFLQ